MDRDTLLRRARLLDHEAERCRTGAALLAGHDLDSLLDEVHRRHLPATWVGRAADASRHRLDAHRRDLSALADDVDTAVAGLLSHARDLTAAAASARLAAAHLPD